MRIPIGCWAGLVVSFVVACGDDDPSEPTKRSRDADTADAAAADDASGPAAGASGRRSRAGSGASGSGGRGGARDAGARDAAEEELAGPDGGDDDPDSGAESEGPAQPSGTFLALTYNVAGLPQGLSSSNPEQNMPLIGPLLNGYDLVFLQESWLTPEDNPFEASGLRVYHEILVAASQHPYQTVPADQPFGNDPSRPSALLGDGLNVFSRFALEDTQRIPWPTCVESASDCLAFKGFSMTPAQLADGGPVHIYDLHMEAGDTPEDDVARSEGIDQLIAYIAEHSQGSAVIVAGDFNLHTDSEPAAMQFQRLVDEAGLTDSCTALDCPVPGSIDKILFRSSDEVELGVESWEQETDVFVTDAGEALSDHDPVAVRFNWSVRD